ncbi:peptide/nickel transport system substrate-binding protein/oligopeptide transport system substrate-binding protein [Tissierella praeacuta]|uniref:peptide ABC transporter substrate-binding protein n=1 Tax=Tissierella praeacuta TaxID=43131 RepID=UPI001049E523|nr:peptide ABC transporter substrate-binding protein [Tissierella praeacuta]TCU77387.1 peptide/nickel transport system substrate-binding protein/oligopeptide transport system substrate-binding protein [Tissierella praeacuta]
MKNFKKVIVLIIVFTLCFGTLTGCGKKGDAPTNTGNEIGTDSNNKDTIQMDKEQVYRFSDKSDITGLNPMLNTTGPDNGTHDFIFETLVADVADENCNSIIKPAAAKDWTISEDGMVYTFNIRENALWNDGVPVTANDFLFTFRTMATPEIGSTNAWLFDGIILNFAEALYNDGTNPKYNKKPEDIGVKVIDEKTIEFTLTKPYGYFLDLLSGAKPIRQDKYEEYGSSYGSSIDKIVMNGPFIMESWDPNVQITFVKNEKYWNAENIKLQKVERKVIQDTATAAQALISGEIDVVDTNDPDWKKLISEDGRFETIVVPDNAPEFLGFNCKNKYFKNPKIRLAFSLAFDREKYLDDLREGQGEPLYSLMPGITNVGDELYSERTNGKNQVLKELMKQYPDPKALLIEGLIEEGFDPDPAKMDISYATRGTTEYSKKSAEWLLQQWKEKLGVEIKIDMIEWNVMWDRVDAGDYDICTAGWGPYYNDPNALLELYDPVNGYFNTAKSGWDGPDAHRFVEILEKASNTPDNQERAELFVEAEKILVGTGVIAPTYSKSLTTFLAKYVKGYYVNPHSSLDYSLIYISGR